MTIGGNIRRLRNRADITQEQLGEIAGVSSMAVSQWENGRAVPRMGAVERMAAYFGVRKSEIIEDTDELDTELAPDERELIHAYRALDARDRAAVLQLAHTLSDNAVPDAGARIA